MAKKTGLGALAYLFGLITGIIVFLAADKKDRFSRFHAAQSIMFNLAVWVIAFVIGIVTAPFAAAGAMYTGMVFPLLMFGALGIVWMVYGVLVFLVWLFLIVKAYSGKEYRIPVLGDWAYALSK